MTNQGISGWAGRQPATSPYIQIEDQKAASTHGGSTTLGSWATHVLNTVVADTAGLAKLLSNQVTLPAGTYRTQFTVIGYGTGIFQGRMQNVSDGTTLVLGTSDITNSGVAVNGHSDGAGRFTIAGPKTIELQMQTSGSRATDGFGNAVTWGVNVYAIVQFWKEA